MTTAIESSTDSELALPRGHSARPMIFYGWVMLPIAMITQIMTSPGQSFAIAVFNQSFTGALRLTEKQLTGAFGLGTFLASLTLPLFGAMMDRWGLRRSMATVVLLLGAACMVASQVHGIVSLFVAFLLLRMFGQGALSLFAANTLAMWFRKRLGTASGMMSVGVVLVMGQLPHLIRYLIDSVGWRWAYALLGVAVWAVMFPILALFFRNRPEDIGQVPDGMRPADDCERLVETPSIDLSGAFRTRAYWIMGCAQAAWAMIVTGLVFNVQKVFLSAGYPTSSADQTLMWFFCAIAAMHLAGGLLADRCRLNRLIAVSIVGMAASTAILLFADVRWLSAAYLVLGLSQGLLGASANTIWARYYGRAHVGKIRGSITTAMVAGSSIGPFVMGMSFDQYGTYAPSLWLFFALSATLSSVALFATPPVISQGPQERLAACGG